MVRLAQPMLLSGVSKTIFKPVVCSAQTVHLSWTDANTISKWIETRFHMTHVTEEFHRVRLKWFPSLWYVWCKLCTYLASRLALSANATNRPSTWASLPRSTSGCIRMISEHMVHLVQTMHLCCTYTNIVSKWTEMRFHITHVTEEFYRVCPKQFSSRWYGRRKSCTYLGPTQTLSPNGSIWDSMWPTSPRNSNGCN
jgi:hypothetical protein